MLHEISESEFHNLFRQPINSMRFSFEELAKAYEARLESIMLHVYESNFNESLIKSFKSEMNKAIEGLRMHCNGTCDSLKKNMEKSYEKIESSNENRG